MEIAAQLICPGPISFKLILKATPSATLAKRHLTHCHLRHKCGSALSNFLSSSVPATVASTSGLQVICRSSTARGRILGVLVELVAVGVLQLALGPGCTAMAHPFKRRSIQVSVTANQMRFKQTHHFAPLLQHSHLPMENAPTRIVLVAIAHIPSKQHRQ